MREGREFDQIPASTPNPGRFSALGFTLDTQTGELTRGEDLVHLRPKTFLLLQYLVQNHHRLVSKEELFRTIWQDAHVTDSTLVGCIQEIRKAFEDDVKTPRFIRTVPRRGYQFIAPLDTAPEPDPLPPATEAEPPPQPPPSTRHRQLVPAAVVLLAISAGAIWLSARKSPAIDEPPLHEIAWWKLDSGAPTTPGVFGKAALFDGERTVIEGIDEDHSFPTGAAPRTILAWLKTATTNGDSTVILNYNTAPELPDSQDSFRLSLLHDGRVSFSRHGWAGQGVFRDLAVGSTRVNDDRWHLVAGTYAGAPSHRGALYIDGVEESAAPMPMHRTEQPGPETRWSIGNGVHRGTFFRGAIDDARIYGYAVRPAILAALHRCATTVTDLRIPSRGDFYYHALASPYAHEPVQLEFHTLLSPSTQIRHTGTDYAGVQLARRSPDCSMVSFRPADLGQDLYASVELLTPAGENGHHTQAGPFFRSRRAAPGDGIQGGSSAGFWVRLHSSGIVTVRRLNPMSTVAFTRPRPNFDPARFHTLEVALKANTLEAALDGELLTFEQAGRSVPTVALHPDWEGPPPVGENRGSTGIYFGAEGNRGLLGGQQARNWQLLPYRPLTPAPTRP
ncbi:MAG: LamG-like jellyroll fold domain-containing protein [Bryobacteraceae bacterium]